MVLPSWQSSAARALAKPHRESRKTESREIEALEAQWRSALLTANASSMDKMLAEDFLGISSSGTLSDKQQYLHRISSHANQFQSIDLLDLKVRAQGTTAIATSKVHAVGSLEGHPVNGIFRYTKVYGRNPAGQWRVLSFEATRVSGLSADDGEMMRGTPLQVFPAARGGTR